MRKRSTLVCSIKKEKIYQLIIQLSNIIVNDSLSTPYTFHISLYISYHLLFLLGDTDGTTATTSSLGVLTTDTETPVVTETTMSTDLLQTFQIFTHLGVNAVGNSLRVLAINSILLSVKEPVGDLVLSRVLKDGNDTFQFFVAQFAGSMRNQKQYVKRKNSLVQCYSKKYHLDRFSIHRKDNIYLLLRSTSAFLQATLAKRRPTPLTEVKAMVILSLPSTLVLSKRIMCWNYIYILLL